MKGTADSMPDKRNRSVLFGSEIGNHDRRIHRSVRLYSDGDIPVCRRKTREK